MIKIIFLLLICSCYFIERCQASSCDCKYHAGGCAISRSAPKGFKCKCNYKGAWTCTGVPFPCNDRQYCKGFKSDYCGCIEGGGDCGAYNDDEKLDCNRKNAATHSIAVPDAADCNCKYHSGGCTIHIPAPVGFKCVCTYKGFWTCQGWAKGCSPFEYCPGDLFTYCGCKQGGGDCGGYPDSDKIDKCDFDKPPQGKCDCNKNSDWTRSSYRITNVAYHMDKAKRSNQRPEAIGSKDIPNASTARQSVEFWITKSLSTTFSFKHTAGISIAVGVTYEVSLTPLSKLSGSLSVEGSYTYEWGKSKTVSLGYTHKFACNGEAKRHTVCDAFLEKGTLEVPYTMRLEHNDIPNCECTSSGVWTGVEHFDQSLVARDLGVCNFIQNGECRN